MARGYAHDQRPRGRRQRHEPEACPRRPAAAGFQTFGAATAEQGIALARKHVPDVILMDLRLPDMDGVDATRKLLAHERTALIPVVAMSASQLEGSEDWLEEGGFAGWLEKPIHVSTFPEQVRRYGERTE